MDIQSFSIVVPNRGCVNACPFCVSRMHCSKYENKMDMNHPHYDINIKEYMKRMCYVAECGCKTLMLTGDAEPQQNKAFLNQFALMHQLIGSPFTNIEMQTTGMRLDTDRDYIRFLRNFVGVNTMAISLSSLDNFRNTELRGGGAKRFVDVRKLCDLLKEYDFNIRICLNLTDEFNSWSTAGDVLLAIKDCKQRLHANQVTFRKMYVSTSNFNSAQCKWLGQHAFMKEDQLKECLGWNSVAGQTVYGQNIRYIEGMSIIYDQDCMAKDQPNDKAKYFILQPDCKLYSQWDSAASLVF